MGSDDSNINSSLKAGLCSAMTRRRFLGLAALGAGGLALGGCGGGGSEATPSSTASANLAAGGTMGILHDMEYLGGGAGAIEKWFADTLAKFKQATGVSYDDVPVVYNDMLTRIQTFNAAKNGPVLQTYFDSYASYQFVYQKYLLWISDYIGRDEIDHWLAKSADLQGKTYIAPFVVESDLLVANRQIMDKAGVDISSRIASWNDFRDALTKVKGIGKVGFMMGIADGLQNVNVYDILTNEVAENRIDVTKWMAGQIPLTDPVANNWIGRLVDLKSNGLINADAADIPLRQAVDRFTAGEAGFMDLNMGDAIRLDANKFQVIPYWQGTGAACSQCGGAGDGVLMTNYGENPEAGARFIRFMHEPEQLASFYEATGEIPADDRFTPPADKPALTAAVDLLKSDPPPWWPGDYLKDDINGTVIATNFNKAAKGESQQDVQASFENDVKAYREQNPEIIKSMESYIQSVGQ